MIILNSSVNVLLLYILYVSVPSSVKEKENIVYITSIVCCFTYPRCVLANVPTSGLTATTRSIDDCKYNKIVYNDVNKRSRVFF